MFVVILFYLIFSRLRTYLSRPPERTIVCGCQKLHKYRYKQVEHESVFIVLC